MKTAERIVLYTGLALSLSLAAGYQWMASPAVATPARAADTRIATIDILGITEKMILSEKYLSARNTNTASQNKMLEDLSKGLQDVIARAGATQENTPERRALEQEFNSKQEEVRRVLPSRHHRGQPPRGRARVHPRHLHPHRRAHHPLEQRRRRSSGDPRTPHRPRAPG
jgi:hypothetical protein